MYRLRCNWVWPKHCALGTNVASPLTPLVDSTFTFVATPTPFILAVSVKFTLPPGAIEPAEAIGGAANWMLNPVCADASRSVLTSGRPDEWPSELTPTTTANDGTTSAAVTPRRPMSRNTPDFTEIPPTASRSRRPIELD